jgi:hypothetical protein
MRMTTSNLSVAACLALSLGACLTNIPDPELGGVYACLVDEDCPGTQSCLQKTCEAIDLPHVEILSPEDEQPLPFGTAHDVVLSIAATDLVLRPRSQSAAAVPGEGHLVVFVDDEMVEEIDTGDLSGGVQMNITIPDTPGAHRIRVQARLNDGTDYDNTGATARNIVWVDDGRQHVALRTPWPGDKFTLDQQLVNAVAAGFNGIEIGAPKTGVQHVHVFYGDAFPACFEDPNCMAGYAGIVPSNENDFGPLNLPAAGAGMVTLTAVVMNPDHTLYHDDMGEPVWSQIEILRSNN